VSQEHGIIRLLVALKAISESDWQILYTANIPLKRVGIVHNIYALLSAHSFSCFGILRVCSEGRRIVKRTS
jgi:hypothetical protein